jgi:CheY-like chemotaxis protein
MKRLLVADDSVTIQKVVELTFAAEKLEIEAVADGEQAIEAARRLQPDLVLADVFMPGRDGYEVCAALKSDPELSHIPVVLLVGSLEPFDEEEASRVQCDAYLTKPFETAELVNVVHSLLNEERKRAPQAAAVAAVPADNSGNGGVSQRTRDSFTGPNVILDLFGARPTAAISAPQLSQQMVDSIVQQVVRRISTDVVREIAWEIVPEVSEMVVRQYLEQKGLPKQ